MPSSCDWWRLNFINLLRWAGQHVISAYPLAGKLSEAGTDSRLWVFIAPFMSLPSTLCFKRYPAAVENQANLCCVRWLSSLLGWQRLFSPQWGWATHFDFQSPVITGNQWGGTASFPPHSFCWSNPGTLRRLPEERAACVTSHSLGVWAEFV